MSRMLKWGGIALLVMAMFFPMIAGRLICNQRFLTWIRPELPAGVEIGSASMGWMSPIHLTDIKLKAKDGTQIATVEAVTSRTTLWDMLGFGKSAPTEIQLEGLKAAFVIRAPRKEATHQVRLGEFLKLAMRQPLPNPGGDLVFHLENSEVVLKDVDGEVLTRLWPITGEYKHLRQGTLRHSFQLTAMVDGTTGAKIEANGNVEGSPGQQEKLRVTVQATQLPTHPLKPVIVEYLDEDFVFPAMNVEHTSELTRLPNELMLSSQSNWGVPDDTGEVPADKDLTFELDARYYAQTDMIEMSRIFGESADVYLDADGTITESSTPNPMADVQGKLASPAAELLALLPEEIRNEIKVDDFRLSEFKFQGPINPGKGFGLQFRLSADMTWKRAEGYGVVSEDGKIRLSYAGNRAELEPVQVPVSGGAVKMLPTFDFNENPAVIEIGEGVLLENVSFTNEMYQQWLQYLSPQMAGATAVHGRFSLDTHAGKFPVGKLEESEISGVLKIHNSEIGPGPWTTGVMQALGGILQLVGQQLPAGNVSWLTIVEEEVPFWMEKGRVHHKDFGFNMGGLRLSTTGSVGMVDETLDLVMTIKMPDEWFAGKPVLAAAFGEEPISVVIGGTLDKPVVDARPLAEYSKRAGIKAAGGLLEKLLNSPLPPPRRPLPRRRPVD